LPIGIQIELSKLILRLVMTCPISTDKQLRLYMHILKVLLLLLSIFVSFAIGQSSIRDSHHFIQNFRKHFHSNIQPAPFHFFNQSFTSSDLYVRHHVQDRPKSLKLTEITTKQFFEVTALHQQTQLGFFDFTAVKKEQLVFKKKLNELYALSLSEYTNVENESRYLIECTKINQKINYYSIVGDRKFNLDEINRAENLCAQF
jgi:hypothetical protein